MSQNRETPASLAPKLGVTPIVFRRWLRGLVTAGHELVKNHQHNERWSFSTQEAQVLLELYRRQND